MPALTRSFRPRRPRGALAAFAVVLAAGASFAAPAGAHRVTVIHGKQVVWTFHTAKCVKRAHVFTAVFGGEDKRPDYAMGLRIDGFDGFHDYPLTLDFDSVVFLKLFGPNGAVYSNIYKPPFPSPGAGKVTFARRGKLLGVGFGPAMYTRAATDAVVLSGVVTCSYKKKPAKRR